MAFGPMRAVFHFTFLIVREWLGELAMVGRKCHRKGINPHVNFLISYVCGSDWLLAHHFSEICIHFAFLPYQRPYFKLWIVAKYSWIWYKLPVVTFQKYVWPFVALQKSTNEYSMDSSWKYFKDRFLPKSKLKCIFI
jgi:hypothetical protein